MLAAFVCLQVSVDHKEGGGDRLWELLLHGGEQSGKGEGLHTDHRCAIGFPNPIFFYIISKNLERFTVLIFFLGHPLTPVILSPNRSLKCKEYNLAWEVTSILTVIEYRVLFRPRQVLSLSTGCSSGPDRYSL